MAHRRRHTKFTHTAPFNGPSYTSLAGSENDTSEDNRIKDEPYIDQTDLDTSSQVPPRNVGHDT